MRITSVALSLSVDISLSVSKTMKQGWIYQDGYHVYRKTGTPLNAQRSHQWSHHQNIAPFQ